jgi:hypothetical protein
VFENAQLAAERCVGRKIEGQIKVSPRNASSRRFPPPWSVKTHTPVIARLMSDTTDRTNKWRSAA